jgi:hypothetical protein
MIQAAMAAIAMGLKDWLDALRIKRGSVGSWSRLRGDRVRLPQESDRRERKNANKQCGNEMVVSRTERVASISGRLLVRHEIGSP